MKTILTMLMDSLKRYAQKNGILGFNICYGIIFLLLVLLSFEKVLNEEVFCYFPDIVTKYMDRLFSIELIRMCYKLYIWCIALWFIVEVIISVICKVVRKENTFGRTVLEDTRLWGLLNIRFVGYILYLIYLIRYPSVCSWKHLKAICFDISPLNFMQIVALLILFMDIATLTYGLIKLKDIK